MNVKVKFAVNDKAYSLEDNKMVEKEVTRLNITVTKEATTIDYFSGDEMLDITKVFTSPSAVFKSLQPKKEVNTIETDAPMVIEPTDENQDMFTPVIDEIVADKKKVK